MLNFCIFFTIFLEFFFKKIGFDVTFNRDYWVEVVDIFYTKIF